ncbi:MAG: hypothetical protein QM740_19655 [Acidovorax sp.]
MLDLHEAAQLARQRITERLAAASKGDKGALPLSAKIIEEGASFRTHLIDSLRKSGDERTAPSPAPDSLFLAFPEKLLGKWHHLAYGAQRHGKEGGTSPSQYIQAWRTWDALGTETKVTNFYSTQTKAVLLAHGLAAIEDSILLLADIGRCSRAARAIGVPLRVLLADVSWISYNRSLRRFDLTDAQIEGGLRSCQAMRQRLYEAVGAEPKVHAIVPFQKRGAISAQKIQTIANHYLQLAAMLWGTERVNTASPLNNSDVAVIGRPLLASLHQDSTLTFLRSFPGALPALESALEHHLNVVRTIAQRFRILSVDTFSYYFAQYYAQNEYRGSHIKVAPVSERDFDEPYDELDESFQLWGEGHDPDPVTTTNRKLKSKSRRRMAAVYLPQYSIGDLKLLPYSPLSLSAVEAAGGKVSAVRERVILISDCSRESQPKIETLLRQTKDRSGAIQLNRLIADVLSFLQTVAIVRGKGTLDAAWRRAGSEMEPTLAALHPLLPQSFTVECEPRAQTGSLWSSWLEGVERKAIEHYVPCHLLPCLFTAEDWTDERTKAASYICLAATRVANDLAT